MREVAAGAPKERILIVEDEQIIGGFLTTLLDGNGYQPLLALSGREALIMTASHNPDLVLLDLGLPDMDGMQVLGDIRGWSDLPIIVVSARQAELEKVRALDAGANDYVTKPFGNDELLARIRTALRQHGKARDHRSLLGSSFAVGELHIDYARRQVTVGKRRIHLTPNEYRIVVLLSHSAGQVLTRETIIREIWGPYASDAQVLRVNMANIRRKLEPNPADPIYILTEVGVGYRMADAP